MREKVVELKRQIRDLNARQLQKFLETHRDELENIFSGIQPVWPHMYWHYSPVDITLPFDPMSNDNFMKLYSCFVHTVSNPPETMMLGRVWNQIGIALDWELNLLPPHTTKAILHVPLHSCAWNLKELQFYGESLESEMIPNVERLIVSSKFIPRDPLPKVKRYESEGKIKASLIPNVEVLHVREVEWDAELPKLVDLSCTNVDTKNVGHVERMKVDWISGSGPLTNLRELEIDEARASVIPNVKVLKIKNLHLDVPLTNLEHLECSLCCPSSSMVPNLVVAKGPIYFDKPLEKLQSYVGRRRPERNEAPRLSNFVESILP